jgi:hypothetical protein
MWVQDDPGDFRDYHVRIDATWIVIEVATALGALIALRFIRFPFLTAPLAFSFWYLSMDLAPLIWSDGLGFDQRKIVSVAVGLVMLIVAYIADWKFREDYAFWGYLFGLLAFWGGLSLMNSDSELNKFLYCLINVFLMFVSVWLQRRAFLVFGAMGVPGYLGYLSWRVFEDSLLFPFALSGLGILLIALAVLAHRHAAELRAGFEKLLPGWMIRFRPAPHRNA